MKIIYLFLLISLSLQLNSLTSEKIYDCSADNIEFNKNNPDKITKIKIAIFQRQELIANRNIVYAEGSYINKDNEEITINMTLVGIPEFLGPNMFHSFFMSSFSNYTSNNLSQFLLCSFFSKTSPYKAILTINNLNEISYLQTNLTCEVGQKSIYIGYNK